MKHAEQDGNNLLTLSHRVGRCVTVQSGASQPIVDGECRSSTLSVSDDRTLANEDFVEADASVALKCAVQSPTEDGRSGG